MTGCFVVYQVLDDGSPWNPMRIDNSLALQKRETPVGWQITDASLSMVLYNILLHVPPRSSRSGFPSLIAMPIVSLNICLSLLGSARYPSSYVESIPII